MRIISRSCHSHHPRHLRHPRHPRHPRRPRVPSLLRLLRHLHLACSPHRWHRPRRTIAAILIGENSSNPWMPTMSENIKPDSIPRCFSPNLISIFGPSTASPRRQKNIDRKRQFLREKLDGHGVIAWCLRHKQSVWERCNWDELRRLVHGTDARPRQWPRYVKEHLIVLSTTTLSDSQAFVELCSSKCLWGILWMNYLAESASRDHQGG